ncbi:hypothetical protein HNQ59_003266 [Chitinivorax tropicus]|uniref:Uncharacterized protein n=1 Tax=Chitinivorax tropicus TaxID=714531 RepID=A0A840MMT8_9PROT|nr:hypothetical protein [Chitinivorax tropicus]MBB5019958.1 hypothetical protein [Chitinivorax tropicus]
MKRVELEKHRGLKINDRLAKSVVPDRFGNGVTTMVDRREQRRLDQAAGLVPFAVKLPVELVKQLQTLAATKQIPLHELVANLLNKQLSDEAE